MNTNEEKLKNISYSVIKDKNIAHQDFLYKLIIIGDTGKPFKACNKVRCREELPVGEDHGQ